MKKINVLVVLFFALCYGALAESVDLDYELDLKINGTGENETAMMYLTNQDLGLDYDTEIKNKETSIEISTTKNVSCQYDDDFSDVDSEIVEIKHKMSNISSNFEDLNGEVNYYDKYINCTSQVATMAEYKRNNENWRSDLDICGEELESAEQEIDSLREDLDACDREKATLRQDLKDEEDDSKFYFMLLWVIGGIGLVGIIYRNSIIEKFKGAKRSEEVGGEKPSSLSEDELD